LLELIKRAKIVFLVCIAVIVLFNYFVIFRLMKLELEDSVVSNFIALSDSKHEALNYAVEKEINGAIALSGKTMLREEIAEYNEGAATPGGPESRTRSEYPDSVMALENVVAAARIVDGRRIAEYTDPGYAVGIDTNAPSDTLSTQIIGSEENIYLIVDSPVLDNGVLLAVDRVVFDLGASVLALNDSQNKVAVITAQQASAISAELTKLEQTAEYALYRDDKNYIFLRPLLNTSYVMTSTLQSELFEPVNRLSVKMLASTALLFSGMLVIFYTAIIRFANKLLETAEKSRHRFENLAYRDELTGAYSRVFLDFWKENLYQQDHQYCIIMIDLDELKDINDGCGHLMGDEVLKIVARAVTRTIRTGDIFIRFGGDEFLIILENVTECTGESIMQRVEAKLNEEHCLDLCISISYGIYAMENECDFNDAILMADRRMYMTKKLKKEQPPA